MDDHFRYTATPFIFLRIPNISYFFLLQEESMESMKPLLLLVFYFMDKVKRFRLTREAKVKADKNRSKVKEAFWKSMHAAKAEKAQVKTL